MHVTLVHVDVKPEAVDAFIAATRANHEASVREPGNRRFEVLQAPDQPGRFILYEAYDSAPAGPAKETRIMPRGDAVATMMARRARACRCALFPTD
jgi:autoinducer 2-degrading protein